MCRLNTLASGTKTGDVSASRFLACAVGETPEVNRVNVLYEDRAGQIWAGTDGGLFRLSEQSGKAVLERVALKVPSRPDRALQIWAFAEDSNGSLWVGTSSGLARRRNDGRTAHYSIQPLRGFDHVWALRADGRNRLWIGHDTGLIVFRPDEIESSHLDSHRLQLSMQPGSTRDHMESPVNPGAAIRFTTEDGLSGQTVLALHLSTDGDLWIGTSHGLTHFDGERFTPYTAAEGNRHVSAVATDRDGHIWIASIGGALKLARTGFVSYTEADGLPQDFIRSIFENRAGELRVVGRRQRVHRYDGTRFTAVQPNLSADRWKVEGLAAAFEDRAGEWWVPGDAGLYRFPPVERLEQLSRSRPRAISHHARWLGR